jgi:hypothetical protein
MSRLIRLILLFFIGFANAQLADAAPLEETCPTAPSARVRAGMMVVVNADGLNLRAFPAVSTGVNARLYRGNGLTVIAGPSCNGHIQWWRVETVNGVRGWVAEGTWESYYVIPQIREDFRVPTPLEWSCGGNFRARLCYTVQ